MVLMRESTAAKLGCKPLARIVSHATHAQEPEWFATAPVGATQKALAKAGWNGARRGPVGSQRSLCRGAYGAHERAERPARQGQRQRRRLCALGHPIGASGARIMVTLIHALKARGLKKGLATLCIGGGEGTAVALELV